MTSSKKIVIILFIVSAFSLFSGFIYFTEWETMIDFFPMLDKSTILFFGVGCMVFGLMGMIICLDYLHGEKVRITEGS